MNRMSKISDRVAMIVLAGKPKLYAVVERFNNIQNRYGSFGAGDTEPSVYFETLMVKAIKGDDWPNPTKEDWQLYNSKVGIGQIVRILNQEAKKAFDEIKKAAKKDQQALAKYVGWDSVVKSFNGADTLEDTVKIKKIRNSLLDIQDFVFRHRTTNPNTMVEVSGKEISDLKWAVGKALELT
jgi:hypothetical protein